MTDTQTTTMESSQARSGSDDHRAPSPRRPQSAMTRRKIARNNPQRPRIGKRRVDEMIEDKLAVPFETTVLGAPVVVALGEGATQVV